MWVVRPRLYEPQTPQNVQCKILVANASNNINHKHKLVILHKSELEYLIINYHVESKISQARVLPHVANFFVFMLKKAIRLLFSLMSLLVNRSFITLYLNIENEKVIFYFAVRLHFG